MSTKIKKNTAWATNEHLSRKGFLYVILNIEKGRIKGLNFFIGKTHKFDMDMNQFRDMIDNQEISFVEKMPSSIIKELKEVYSNLI